MRRTGQIVVGVVATLLLVSWGGAIPLAPVTLPLLWWAGRDARPFWRGFLDLVAALTAAEAVWAITYVFLGEATALIWGLPLAAALAVGLTFARTQRPRVVA